MSANILAIVEGVEVSAPVDTGSTISIVGEYFRNSHPMLRKRPIKTSMVLARSVTGQCLDTRSFSFGHETWHRVTAA